MREKTTRRSETSIKCLNIHGHPPNNSPTSHMRYSLLLAAAAAAAAVATVATADYVPLFQLWHMFGGIVGFSAADGCFPRTFSTET